MQSRLDVGGVIRRVFDIYVDQASVLMPAAAVVFVFTGIIAALLVVASPGLALVALLIDLVAGTLFTGMVVELVADVQDGRRDASPGQLLRAATPVLGQLILVGIVAGIGIVVGFFLIIVPGLILITIWSVAAPVVVLERPARARRARAQPRARARQRLAGVRRDPRALHPRRRRLASSSRAVAESAGSGVGIVVRVIVGVLTAPLVRARRRRPVLRAARGARRRRRARRGPGSRRPGGPEGPGGPSAGDSDAERAFGG